MARNKESGTTLNRRRFLRNGGITLATLPVLAGGSAAYTSDHDFETFTMSLAYDDYRNEYVAELRWDWGGNPNTTHNPKPDDIAGIYWENDKWILEEPNYNTSDQVNFKATVKGDGYKGVTFEHEDWYCCNDQLFYCACTLTPDGDFTENERNIYGELTHTYTDTDIESVGLDATGVVVTLTRNEKQWDKGAVTDQSEASSF